MTRVFGVCWLSLSDGVGLATKPTLVRLSFRDDYMAVKLALLFTISFYQVFHLAFWAYGLSSFAELCGFSGSQVFCREPYVLAS